MKCNTIMLKVFLAVYMHQFGWLSERGGNLLNLLQKEVGTQKEGVSLRICSFETIINFSSILCRHLKGFISLLLTKSLLQTGSVSSNVTILFDLKLENVCSCFVKDWSLFMNIFVLVIAWFRVQLTTNLTSGN